MPASTPMMTALVAVTKPAQGVMTTKPPTAPEQKPRTEGLPRVIHSAAGQAAHATAVQMVVVMKTCEETPSATTALPASKPYQPTQSIPEPIMVNTMLCGAKFSLPKPLRLPTMRASTSADQPDDMCTTVPPAKSMALMPALAFHTPFMKPSMPQTMCASRKYTRNIQPTMNNIRALNFMRSAMAPTMSAGVMMANMSWYIAHTLWETQAA